MVKGARAATSWPVSPGPKDVMINFEMPTEHELADAERQYEWRVRSVERLTAERADRTRSLEARKESIRRALQAYRDLPARYAAVHLRAEFIALRNRRELPPALGGPEPEQVLDRSAQLQDDYRTRPASAKLLMRKTHALQSYLAMIYVTNAERPDGRDRSNATRTAGAESWAVLCGRWAPTPRARRARMARDLEELLRADLVAIGPPGAQGRYENFRLLAEDSTGNAYTRPRRGQRMHGVALPYAFFTSGWHLALSPAEIAVLLMVRHAELTLPPPHDEPGVALPRTTRWSVYGISGEAYESIHELAEFGLLKVYDTMPHRRHGKLRLLSPSEKSAVEASGDSTSPVPYRLETAPDEAFDRPALDIIQPSLRHNPAPPRLAT
jgi:hypothetical protein